MTQSKNTASAVTMQKLENDIKHFQQEASKAQGALEEMLKTLENKFGVKTIKDAEELLEQLEEEHTEAKAEFDEAFAKFEKEWDEYLG